MKKNLKAPGSRINRLQILIGVAGLIVGSLIYLIDRPPDQTYFVYSNPINITLSNTIPTLFGSIGNSLPALIHVFSFILITAGLIFYNKRAYLIICVFWFIVDSAFELGQKFHDVTSCIIPDWFVGVPFLENIETYFLHGTFDVIDLAAIAFGGLIAYFFISITGKGEHYHEKTEKWIDEKPTLRFLNRCHCLGIHNYHRYWGREQHRSEYRRGFIFSLFSSQFD